MNDHEVVAGRTPADIAVFPTVNALIQAAAEQFVAAASAVHAAGRFAVALSGGSTPRRLYELLATERYAARVDWPRVHVFWGDERCVPPDDPASNYGIARTALLDHVPIPTQNIHRIQGEIDPIAAASAYERELRTIFETAGGPPQLLPGRRFDLVLLGMGDNGHTASLFPGSAAVRERTKWVMAEPVEAVSMWRVTLTPVVINAAAEVRFLVHGAEKAAALHAVLKGPYQPSALPAQAIAPHSGRLCWLVDEAAAAYIEKTHES